MDREYYESPDIIKSIEIRLYKPNERGSWFFIPEEDKYKDDPLERGLLEEIFLTKCPLCGSNRAWDAERLRNA